LTTTYILSCDNLGLISEGSEDTATKSTEDCLFRTPHW